MCKSNIFFLWCRAPLLFTKTLRQSLFTYLVSSPQVINYSDMHDQRHVRLWGLSTHAMMSFLARAPWHQWHYGKPVRSLFHLRCERRRQGRDTGESQYWALKPIWYRRQNVAHWHKKTLFLLSLHCKSNVNSFESIFPTSNPNASQCICLGKHGRL